MSFGKISTIIVCFFFMNIIHLIYYLMMIVAVFTKIIDYFLSLPKIKYNIYISYDKILCIYLIIFS